MSVVKWHGGKSYLAKWIHSLAPPSVNEDKENGYTHRHIVCAGGLGEFWNWLPLDGISETINDVDGDVSNFWSVLQSEEDFERFQKAVEATPFSQVEFDSVQRLADSEWAGHGGPINRALIFFIKFRMSRQGLGKDYATPTKRTRGGMNEQVSAWLSAVEGLPDAHARLKRVEIRNLDCRKYLKTYDHPRALFYLDPPYLHSTRQTGGGDYANEMSDLEHADLLVRLSELMGRFMLSGYHSELYDDVAAHHGWHCHEREIDNKASSQAVKPTKTECVWTNYELG